jgi:hypothetical protein
MKERMFLILEKHGSEHSNEYIDPTYGDVFTSYKSAEAYAEEACKHTCMIVEVKGFV